MNTTDANHFSTCILSLKTLVKNFIGQTLMTLCHNKIQIYKRSLQTYNSTHIRRKLGFCNQPICNQLRLFDIQNYCWLYLQLLFAFGLACNYSMTNLRLMDFFIPSFRQLSRQFPSKKTPLLTISCKCHQMSCSPIGISNVLYIFQA